VLPFSFLGQLFNNDLQCVRLLGSIGISLLADTTEWGEVPAELLGELLQELVLGLRPLKILARLVCELPQQLVDLQSRTARCFGLITN